MVLILFVALELIQHCSASCIYTVAVLCALHGNNDGDGENGCDVILGNCDVHDILLKLVGEVQEWSSEKRVVPILVMLGF